MLTKLQIWLCKNALNYQRIYKIITVHEKIFLKEDKNELNQKSLIIKSIYKEMESREKHIFRIKAM